MFYAQVDVLVFSVIKCITSNSKCWIITRNTIKPGVWLLGYNAVNVSVLDMLQRLLNTSSPRYTNKSQH